MTDWLGARQVIKSNSEALSGLAHHRATDVIGKGGVCPGESAAEAEKERPEITTTESAASRSSSTTASDREATCNRAGVLAV